MRHVALYTDLAFCLVLLPLMIYAFPVERWWGTSPLFFCSFLLWLYATYFIYKYVVVPRLFHGGRQRVQALVVVTRKANRPEVRLPECRRLHRRHCLCRVHRQLRQAPPLRRLHAPLQDPLYTVEEQLPPQGEFLCIHRSFIVSRSRIKSYTRTCITLSTEPMKRLPIGKKYFSIEEMPPNTV